MVCNPHKRVVWPQKGLQPTGLGTTALGQAEGHAPVYSPRLHLNFKSIPKTQLPSPDSDLSIVWTPALALGPAWMHLHSVSLQVLCLCWLGGWCRVLLWEQAAGHTRQPKGVQSGVQGGERLRVWGCSPALRVQRGAAAARLQEA